MPPSIRPIAMLFAIGLLVAGREGLADIASVMDIPHCASLTADCGYARALADAGNPSDGALRVFAAIPPYSVTVNSEVMAVNLGNRSRYFDFGGERPFVNPTTGVSDIAAINAASDDGVAAILASDKISDAGIPGRVYKHSGRTILRYVAGDPPVAGKCRSQFASYPVPAQQHFVFDLAFQLGEPLSGHEWHLSPPRESPAVIWQMKAPDVIPSMAIGVDTDPAHPDSLLLFFSRKSAFQTEVTRVGSPVRIKPNQPLRLLMDVYLDERNIAAGGRGYWRAWINGKLVLDVFGPTLSALAKEPHQWFLTLYQYNNPQPLPFNRSVIWKRARMLYAPK